MALPFSFTATCVAKGAADAAGNVFVVFSTVASANIGAAIPLVIPILAAAHHGDFTVGQVYTIDFS